MTGSGPDLGQLEPVYTTAEIAKALRLSPFAIRRWCRTGQLDAFKAGREFRVKKSVLDAYLAEIGFTTLEPATP